MKNLTLLQKIKNMMFWTIKLLDLLKLKNDNF